MSNGGARTRGFGLTEAGGKSRRGNEEREQLARLRSDVRDGLSRTPKEIPFTYLYDALGSALFEAITLLPEYGLTRADERLLARHAPEIVRCVPAPFAVAELGSGSGRKTRFVLEAAQADHLAATGTFAARATSPVPVRYFPIDVSRAALDVCTAELSSIPGVEIRAIEADHIEGLRRAVFERGSRERFLVLFLGSCIGNFGRQEAGRFLAQVRGLLRPGDAMLIGADLEKDIARMLLAYDDPIGVTAAFNRNVLARLNRDLGTNFVPENFDHEARWNAAERCVEMHLVARCAQTVLLASEAFNIERGETIRTEQCHKYRTEDLDALARASGFRPTARWIDEEWRFTEDFWLAA